MKYLLLSFNSSLLLYLKIDLSTAFVNKIGPVTFNISNVTLPECKIGTGYKNMNNKIFIILYNKMRINTICIIIFILGFVVSIFFILIDNTSKTLTFRAFKELNCPDCDISKESFRKFKKLNCNKNINCDVPEYIPMVIYRSWKTKDLPLDYQLAWDFTAKNNPDYQQILFDDNEMDEFMEKFYSGKVNNAYKKIIPNAARADLFRYCLIYEKGGVWLDIKSAAKPLCDLIKKYDKLIFSTWGDQLAFDVQFLFNYIHTTPYKTFGEFQQWWIISAPKHPMIKACIDLVVNNIEERIAEKRFEKEIPQNLFIQTYGFDTLLTTGPIAFSSAILKHKSLRSEYRLVCADANGIMIYDYTGNHKGGTSYAKKGLFFKKD